MAQPPLNIIQTTAQMTARREITPSITLQITAYKADMIFLLVTLTCLALSVGLLVFAPVAGLILVGLQVFASLLLVLRAVLVCHSQRGMR